MTPAENEFFGKLAEAAARTRFELSLDRGPYHDARDGEDRPVETKACRRTLANGRSGRWWIDRESHEQLLAEDGRYALLVYDPGAVADGPILEATLETAADVDEWLSWTGCGPGHDVDEHAKLGWRRVVDAPEVTA